MPLVPTPVFYGGNFSYSKKKEKNSHNTCDTVTVSSRGNKCLIERPRMLNIVGTLPVVPVITKYPKRFAQIHNNLFSYVLAKQRTKCQRMKKINKQWKNQYKYLREEKTNVVKLMFFVALRRRGSNTRATWTCPSDRAPAAPWANIIGLTLDSTNEWVQKRSR